MELKLVKCTDQGVNCAPQRLLRREGDADLKERHGRNINTALITLHRADCKTQTCTSAPLPPTTLSQYKILHVTSIKNSILQILEKQVYPTQHRAKPQMYLFGYVGRLLRHFLSLFDQEAVSHFNYLQQNGGLSSTKVEGGIMKP